MTEQQPTPATPAPDTPAPATPTHAASEAAGTAAGAAAPTAGPSADPRAAVLVTVTELAADLGLDGTDPVPGPPVLVDVRWALAAAGERFDGLAHYRAGHLPGAVFADLETELAATPSPAEGRHPLPSTAQLQAAARRWGVHEGSRVVVYDALGGMSAARAWWRVSASRARSRISESTVSPPFVAAQPASAPINAREVATLTAVRAKGARES